MKKINVLFSTKVEFKTITENLKSVLLNNEKINLIILDKNQELNQLVSIMEDTDFDVFLHKNEHCQLNTCVNIKKAIDFCYKKNKVPAYVDFGYFDHYKNYIIDYYLPNYKSSIEKVFPTLDQKITDLQKPIETYISSFKQKIENTNDTFDFVNLNLSKQNFAVIWAQFDTFLLKDSFKKETPNNESWILRLCKEIKNQNLVPVVKISPCEVKYDLNEIKKESLVIASTKEQSEKFDIPNIPNANFYLNKYAHSHFINCSSISNELILNNSKITAMGKSWFNGLEIFHEPENWSSVMNYKNASIVSINQWINWWNLRQAPIKKLDIKILEIFKEFYK